MQLIVFLLFCGTDFGVAIYRHANNQNDNVGYLAHLCGALAGLLVGIAVLRNLKVELWEKKLSCIAVTVFSCLMLSAITFHLFNDEYFSPKNIDMNNSSITNST